MSNQAHQLRKLGRPKAALTAAEEALRLLTLHFLENPSHYMQWTALALSHYLGAAEEAGMEPDLEKVAAIAAVFARGNE